MEHDPTDDALQQLEDMLCDPMLSDRVRRSLRQFAALQMQAEILFEPNLSANDRRVASLLIGRWLEALVDSGLAPTLLADPVEISANSLAHVLDLNAEAVDLSLRQLASFEFTTVERADDMVGFSFGPLFQRIGRALATILYRDLLDRQGLDLYEIGCAYLERTSELMAELSKLRPGDPRVSALKSDYSALIARNSPDKLLALWPVKPKAFYVWLEDLAAIEERLAMLTKFPDTALASELRLHTSEKILILSGRFTSYPVGSRA